MRCNDQSVLLAMHIAMSNTCSNESLNVKRDRPRAEDPLHILKVAPPARMNRWVANQNEQHSSHGERRRSEPWFLHATREFNSHKRHMRKRGLPWQVSVGKALLWHPEDLRSKKGSPAFPKTECTGTQRSKVRSVCFGMRSNSDGVVSGIICLHYEPPG